MTQIDLDVLTYDEAVACRDAILAERWEIIGGSPSGRYQHYFVGRRAGGVDFIDTRLSRRRDGWGLRILTEDHPRFGKPPMSLFEWVDIRELTPEQRRFRADRIERVKVKNAVAKFRWKEGDTITAGRYRGWIYAGEVRGRVVLLHRDGREEHISPRSVRAITRAVIERQRDEHKKKVKGHY